MNSDCPTWCVSSRKEMTAGLDGECECGASVDGAIDCNCYTKQVEIRIGWCMTDLNGLGDGSNLESKFNVSSTVVIGKCPYLLVYNTTNRAYASLTSDSEQVTHAMCDHYHRTGLLCGQCVEGCGLAVFSSDLHCSNCSDMSAITSIFLHILLESIPSVLLFILLVLFNVSIMSGPMFAFCQYFIFVIRSEPQYYNSALLFLPSPLVFLTKVSMTLSAV